MAKMTPMLHRLHKLAKRHHLPNALGRAIYVLNRHYNAGPVGWGGDPGPHREADEIKFMRTIKPETAKRWLLHWSNDGSLKALKYSREEFLALRRKRYAEVKQFMA